VLLRSIPAVVWFALIEWNVFTMSSSEEHEPIESSSEDEQEEQHGGDQQVTGATADPQVLQLFWDLASLEQVGTRLDPTAAVHGVAWHHKPRSRRIYSIKLLCISIVVDLSLRVRLSLSVSWQKL
jgi:hypothetical protein